MESSTLGPRRPEAEVAAARAGRVDAADRRAGARPEDGADRRLAAPFFAAPDFAAPDFAVPPLAAPPLAVALLDVPLFVEPPADRLGAADRLEVPAEPRVVDLDREVVDDPRLLDFPAIPVRLAARTPSEPSATPVPDRGSRHSHGRDLLFPTVTRRVATR